MMLGGHYHPINTVELFPEGVYSLSDVGWRCFWSGSTSSMVESRRLMVSSDDVAV